MSDRRSASDIGNSLPLATSAPPGTRSAAPDAAASQSLPPRPQSAGHPAASSGVGAVASAATAARRSGRVAADDPALLPLIRGALSDICNAMDDSVAARSRAPQLSRDRAFANGVFHPETGATLAVSGNGAPLLAVTLQDGLSGLLTILAGDPDDPVQPGDVFLFNDPFLGTTQATDLRMATPVFRDGTPMAWIGNACRWAALGGGAPGGIAPHAVDHGAEGLRIPPVRLFGGGRIERGVTTLLLGNVADADQCMNDILAQAAALGVGVERLEAVFARFGGATVDRAVRDLTERADARARRRLVALPEGRWRAETFLDGDGIGNEPMRLSLALIRRGTDLVLDLSGSSPPCRGALNCPPAVVRGAARLALHGLFPDLPMEGGSWQPLQVKMPVGTFLHALPPSPVSAAAALVVPRIIETVFAAIGQLIPDQMPARSGYGGAELAVDGVDPGLPATEDTPAQAGGRFAARLALGAGRGARAGSDGATPLAPPYGPTGFGSVEALERTTPMLFSQMQLRRGGGGLGATTGGDGLVAGLQVMRGSVRLAVSADLGKDGPSGRAGGLLGTPGQLRIRRGQRSPTLSRHGKEADLMLAAGDSVLLETPGGGGFGPPTARPVPDVVVDMLCGRVSVATARAQYGVAIDPASGQIDPTETERLRGTTAESPPTDSK